MVLFYAAIRRDPVFLLRFPFLNHVQVLPREISLVYHLKYPYSYFSFDGVPFQYSQVFRSFLFSERSDFSWFGSSIPSVRCRFPLLIISMAYFSMPNSILISWLYFLTNSIRVFNSFSFLANSLMSSMYIRWLIFSSNLLLLLLLLLLIRVFHISVSWWSFTGN